MYMNGLADAMTDAEYFGNDSGAFESGYTESPSNYQVPVSTPTYTPPYVPPASQPAASGSPSWSSLTQSFLTTYEKTQAAKSNVAVANAQRDVMTAQRYPSSYYGTTGFSPFPVAQTGSVPRGLSTGSIIAMLMLGVGAVVLMRH